CDKVENSNVIAPGLFKLSVSQSVSSISMSKMSCDSKNVENVKRYSRKDLLSCNNSHLGETSSAYVCNDAMNVSCNSRLYDLFDENNLFIFDDENVRISPVSKMPFRKKPRDSMNIVQICLWIIDSGCSKHMTGNRAMLTNFVKKFLGTVCFGNNDFTVIAGYGDVVIGSMTIEKSTCFVRNEDGVDLLTGDRSSNLYTVALNEVASNSLTCLLAKASSSQSWLWHQHLFHLNFTIINNLMKNNLVQCLSKMKFEKDHLCSACEQGKIHRKHHKSKTAFDSKKPLYLLHMDLCGPMRVESINEKRYMLVVVDDYSRSIELANVAEALRDADWVSTMQDELDQFARLKVWRLVFLEILLISLKIVEFELKVIHISVVCCGVGFEFALRNRVLLWKCLKIRVLRWSVMIDSSLVWLTVLIEIIALKTILVVVLLSRLMKSRWTYLIRNVLTILNEFSD
nr:hypothetical protein [Tanacetum cinerariifolium]